MPFVLLCQCVVQFSSVPRPIGSAGEHGGRFSTGLLPVFSAGDHREQFWHGQGRPFLVIVPLAFPLPTAAPSTLADALKDGFGETVLACDMPKPRNFSSPGSCQKRFLLAHKEVDLAPLPFPRQARSMSQSHRGGWKRQDTSYNLNLFAKRMMLLRQVLLSRAIVDIG